MKKNIIRTISIIILIITFIIDFFFNEKTNFQYENLINITYLLGISIIFYLTNKDNKNNYKYYLLFYIILYIYLSFNRDFKYNYQFYNLIPFRTILSINNNQFILKTLIYNLVIFIPFGIIIYNLKDENKYFKNYFITITFLTVLIRGLGYLFHYMVFDIDDIILNIIGSLITYIILKKNKYNIKINIKEKNKTIWIIIIYIIIILISIYKILGGSVSFYNIYHRDFSHITCIKTNEKLITSKGNYHYYSNCDYQNSYVIAGHYQYSIRDYINSFYFKESDIDKLKLYKKEILHDINIYQKNNIIKEIKTNTYIKKYLVNIDYITLYKDNTLYEIKDIIPDDINIYSLVKFNRNQNFGKYHVIIYEGEYFNIINIHLQDKAGSEYIIPKNYPLNERNITKLYNHK